MIGRGAESTQAHRQGGSGRGRQVHARNARLGIERGPHRGRQSNV